MHHKSRHFGWPTHLKSTELTAALTQRRGESAVDPASGSGEGALRRYHAHADARQALTYLRLAGLPNSEALFEVIGGYRGVPDQFNEVLHAGRNRREARFLACATVRLGFCSSSMRGQAFTAVGAR